MARSYFRISGTVSCLGHTNRGAERIVPYFEQLSVVDIVKQMSALFRVLLRSGKHQQEASVVSESAEMVFTGHKLALHANKVVTACRGVFIVKS